MTPHVHVPTTVHVYGRSGVSRTCCYSIIFGNSCKDPTSKTAHQRDEDDIQLYVKVPSLFVYSPMPSPSLATAHRITSTATVYAAAYTIVSITNRRYNQNHQPETSLSQASLLSENQ
eukprot:32178-Eustigmatos_ZCMA.PRE.1